MEERHDFEWFKHNDGAHARDDQPDDGAKLAEQHKQQEKDMIARHYKEAKEHPESPDLTASWDEYFRPKGLLNPDEWVRQQKTEQQKIADELRSAVANEKGVFANLERETAAAQKKLEEEGQRREQESKRKADELIKRLEEEHRRSPRNPSLDFDYDL